MGMVQGQIQKGELIEGKTAFSEITPNEKHQYKVNLAKDQFAFFRLMQKGVDLRITTYDDKGEIEFGEVITIPKKWM